MAFSVISGCQTGVDRAAADVAMELGIAYSGYVPKGRLAEDGPVPDRYPVTELDSESYAYRTKRNILAANGTLVLIRDEDDLAGGTSLTLVQARAQAEALGAAHAVCLARLDAPGLAVAWGYLNHCFRGGILNVAGPRESKRPGIYEEACLFLRTLFRSYQESRNGDDQRSQGRSFARKIAG